MLGEIGGTVRRHRVYPAGAGTGTGTGTGITHPPYITHEGFVLEVFPAFSVQMFSRLGWQTLLPDGKTYS